jgi:phosphonopyruvate decarboxylase
MQQIAAWLAAPQLDGPHFACLLTRSGTSAELPRPSMTPVEVKVRLMRQLEPAAGAG